MMRQWAKKRRLTIPNKIVCYEVSSKTGEGVSEVFNKAVDIFVRKPVSTCAPNFQPTVSSVVDNNESSSVASRSRSSSRFGDDSDDDIPVAKIVLAGPPGVGKTCILQKFISSDSDIPVRHEPTVGADFRVSEVGSSVLSQNSNV